MLTAVRTEQVGRVDQKIRELTADQAAGLLGVSPDILRRWEHRFGYPRAESSSDGERIYVYCHIVALRNALMRELSITSAIRTARHVLDQTSDAAPRAPSSGASNPARSRQQLSR
jgi:MerR HTH family regulatory protein